MTEPFTSAPHHDVLLLLVQITLLLFAARAMGEVARRLGQPSVVGEIMAGIILGPSLLSGLFPALGAWIVPHGALGGYLLEVVSLLGALLLLLITGLETDLGLIRQHARTAMGVSFGGILVTFTSGFVLGWYLPADLLAQPGQGHRLVFALFVATAMSISAIPVIAKVLMDMDLMRRDVGQTIIAAGMSDDTIGWMLLSIVAGLAGHGGGHRRRRVPGGGERGAVHGGELHAGTLAGEARAGLRAGRGAQPRPPGHAGDRPDVRLGRRDAGAGAGGGARRLRDGHPLRPDAAPPGGRAPQADHHLAGVFTPIFFAVAGLKVNARALLEPQLLLIALLVIAVASGGKIVGTYLGARLIGGATTGRRSASARGSTRAGRWRSSSPPSAWSWASSRRTCSPSSW
jgi:Kef-type K+ transport system membrane component KefB